MLHCCSHSTLHCTLRTPTMLQCIITHATTTLLGRPATHGSQPTGHIKHSIDLIRNVIMEFALYIKALPNKESMQSLLLVSAFIMQSVLIIYCCMCNPLPTAHTDARNDRRGIRCAGRTSSRVYGRARRDSQSWCVRPPLYAGLVNSRTIVL